MERIEKIALSRGYVVTEDGELLNPTGKKLGYSTNAGYVYTNIKVEKVVRQLAAHRLQAYQKYGSRMYEKGIEVRHVDGNPSNNSWFNILIGTHSENMMDIPEQVRIKKARHASSFIRKYDRGEVTKYYERTKSYKKTMKKFNISSKGTLHFILNGR